jgi:hydroxyquinol 1,2-dioxygenase
VTAVSQRKPKGCTEATVPYRGGEEAGEPCFVRGRVLALDGAPIAAAEVCIGQADGDEPCDVLHTDADGCFSIKTTVAASQPIAHDGPVGRLLHALGRHPWRPAHLHFTITARGYERLATQVFRQGDPYLDADAVFGVRSSLVADWVSHEAGRAPDGHSSAVPFTTLDFDFILDKASEP